MNKLAIDKDKSLKIISDIFNHIKNPEDICLNEKFTRSVICSGKVIDFKHKMSVYSIQIEDRDNGNDVNNYEKELNESDEIEISDIEFYDGCEIKNGEINLVSYIYPCYESDVSYPTFKYNEKYKCWIVTDKDCDAINGIDCNGNVIILDFSSYN